MLTRLVSLDYFEKFILTLILTQSVLLAFENPLLDPKSSLFSFLVKSDIFFTSVFTFECISKIISTGMLFNGKDSFLRNGWNLIDFIVVILSIISLSMENGRLKIFKVFRLLKVVRPIRVISRNKGLKIGIQALFMAIPNIFNVIVVALLFFIIFGIIGVNYFKGSFYSCQFGRNIPEFLDHAISNNVIVTKYDCLNYGAVWLNADRHFDNIF